ncbi:MAG: hypothetical protein ACI9TH_001409 [Kiritimatiellia bacterium]|jgi:hypothetical protein
MSAAQRAILVNEPEDLDRLIEDYADGTLDPADAQRLLELIQSSEAVRLQVAVSSVTERLLRAMGKGAVPTSQILEAIRAEQVVPALPPASASRSVSVFWPLALLLLAASVLICVFFWPETPSPSPVETAATSQPITQSSIEKPPIAPAPVAEIETPVTAPKPSARSLYEPFPLMPPPPMDVADLTPPTGDGSDEAGFVLPPAAWLAEREQLPTREQGTPEPPPLWAKLLTRHGDATPNDLHGLNRAIRDRLQLDYGVRKLGLDALVEDPASHPILFLSTHYHFVFTPDQRITLRRYLLNGGMIIFNAGLGSQPAIDSARRELRLIFPEIPIEQLGRDHPLLSAYYDLKSTESVPVLEGLALSCRTAALISSSDLAAGWGGKEGDGVVPEDQALRIGINLFTYATSTRAWAKRSGQTAAYLDTDAQASDRMNIAQVMHSGEWRPRYTGLPMLLRSYNQRTEVPIKLRVKAVALGDPTLFNHPLLYLTGHEPLKLSTGEVQALREYLVNGGFLFAEACCGREGFDRSFRSLMQQVFPEHPLTVIPADSDLFKVPNHIELLGVTQALGAKRESMLLPPRLEAVQVDGLYAVIYSPYGIAGGWEMSPSPYANGYNDPDTLKLGQNILQYIITH